ncbi:hypothetical protein BJ085DRAFT_17728 [Dimargaris cristalligena]|uniref:Uncharacterized protein n=1 Tax=Dimargaris cristalligena TaxID=215637 RepID=A0A4P9ZQU4_9FUNG|nr:hypothetical protein BJ085DRAFT_17728 [Dimargaris cristalligena]|eukprot:RKP35012.1 hypothetical protein BJ085DRAFT_17728 [Dimargaris cristalligena]
MDSVPVVLQGVYCGVDAALDSKDPTLVHWAVCTHDGSFYLDFHEGSITLALREEGVSIADHYAEHMMTVLRRYARERGYKILAISVGVTDGGSASADNEMLQDIHHAVLMKSWFDMDSIPFEITTEGDSIQERAASGVRKIVDWLSPQTPVDVGGHIRISDLPHYEDITHAGYWQALIKLAHECRERDLTMSFFNSTPQGGGVALMRHATIRLLNLLGVDAHWYVAKPNPAVFQITKCKFHNVLQGVAKPDLRLTDDEKKLYIEWCEMNFDRYWITPKGPVQSSDVIIMDDPQLAGIIPRIKESNPNCKIIFRSHIEIRSDLVAIEGSPQHDTWSFLWQFIKHADLFISHPVAGFIPPWVEHSRVVLMPASTDPLDGLNKHLNLINQNYYHVIFNRICNDQLSPPLSQVRPYIIQIARFDPSKGIPDCLEAFRLLRERMAKNKDLDVQLPQLVICGHGSVDDPDGAIVYQDTIRRLSEPQFEEISDDICVARIPPCDQLLNALLSGSYCALQLSTREGFEVKVTESLAKGKPVVAYATGGIPLQIKHGKTGFLVPTGDIAKAADTLYDLMTDRELYERIHTNAKRDTIKRQEYHTPFQTVNWLFLATRLMEKNRDRSSTISAQEAQSLVGRDWGCRYVKDYWFKAFGVKVEDPL